MRLTHPLLSFVSLFVCISAVMAFSVTVGTAAQCAPLTVSWTGGQGPFEIMIFPAYNIPRFYSVPSAAYSENQGSYSIPQLPLTQGTQFVLTMSDATGFAAGGTSNLITVGGPTGTSCDTTNPTPPYYFSTSSDLQQCSPFTFYGYEGAQLPVTILGLIPGGESFVIQDGVSVANYSWTVDVAAGISLLFSMIDAGGNTGGATAVTDVSPSSNSSCLNSNSPSSTASVPQSSTTSTTSASPNTSSDSSKISTATIIGVAAAGIIALAALVFLGLFLTRRRRKQRSMYSLATSRDVPLLQSGDLHRNPSSSAPNPHVYPFPYQATPVDPSFSSGQATPQTMTHDSPPGTNPNAHSFMGYTDTVNSRVSSSGSRKGSMTVLTTPTRYIVHTDAEDASSTPGEVIELPPQYSERRMPASLLSSSRPMSSISEQGSTDLAYASTAFTDVDSHPQLHPPP